ncbi:MAG TPA: competence/damage-inducible protein A [Ilumatobacteraceae bacterium]|nr:competence/damage-inducible protein A [Ilumatobacteraceae bacterium]
MRCDVVAVGTELLLGQIVDTNSAWIGEQLAANGMDSLLQVKVGDNLGRVEAVLRSTLANADAVVVCGGLGPTHDDLTREAIAAVMGVDLLRDDAVAAVITEMFAVRGRYMAANNLRQAMVPVGATIIPQTRGTAPGLICPITIGGVDKVVYAVPGVPHEMKEMVERAVLPDLRRRSGDTGVIVSRTLRTWGESESGLNERLDALIARLDDTGNPTLAFLASGWEGLKVRLTAKAATREDAEVLLDTWDAEVRLVVGEHVFGVDDETMESVALAMLRSRGLTLALAESVTGGLVAGRLTAVPGASDVVRGAVVSYASEVKFDLLGVPQGPVVNEAAAAAMATGVRRVLDADVGLALTGVAGPTEQDGMPVGTLCVGIDDGRAVVTRTFRLPGQREQMRQMSVITALDYLRRHLAASE